MLYADCKNRIEERKKLVLTAALQPVVHLFDNESASEFCRNHQVSTVVHLNNLVGEVRAAYVPQNDDPTVGSIWDLGLCYNQQHNTHETMDYGQQIDQNYFLLALGAAQQQLAHLVSVDP